MQRTLTITWRDENYGALSGVKAAFRLYDTADFDDDAVEAVHAAACLAGFEWHDGRCAFVAYSLAAAHAFVLAAERLDYAVAHSGRWSALPNQLGI